MLTIMAKENTPDKMTMLATVTAISDLLSQEIKSPEVNKWLLAYGAAGLDGVSPERAIANIITRQGEFGADFSHTLPDGEVNMINQLIKVTVEEIFREIRMHGRVEVASKANEIKFVGTGANAGGPVVITGHNYLPGKSYGVIR